MMKKNDLDFYRAMLRTAKSAGLPIISMDTAARICAAVYILGNNESLVMSQKVRADLEYIEETYGVKGTGKPSAEFAHLLRLYSDEIERNYDDHRRTIWVDDMFKKRYGIKLIN